MPNKPKTHRTFPPASKYRPGEQARNALPHRVALRSARYYRFRRMVLARRPLCEAGGCHEIGTDIHHVRGLEQHPEDLCNADLVQVL